MWDDQGLTLFSLLGNFYSIENDYDTTARLWFAQACEIPASLEEMGLEPPPAE